MKRINCRTDQILLAGDQWVISGIYKDRMSPGCLQLAKDWLHQCDTEHPGCFKYENEPLPDRVLDVGMNDSSQPVLRLSKDLDVTQKYSRYAALSYCWGKNTKLVTTTNILSKRMCGIRFDSFPPSLRDAVLVTRALGIRYLWIDSLCIIQDDIKDWEKQSEKMGDIYRHSYITIAATSSPGTDTGWLQSSISENTPLHLWDRDKTDEEKTHYQSSLPSSIYLIPQTKPWDSLIDTSPLGSRGWAMQERLLPSRVLHYGSQQLAFECISDTSTEATEFLPNAKQQGRDTIQTGLHISRLGRSEHGSALRLVKEAFYKNTIPLPVDVGSYTMTEFRQPGSVEERTLLLWYDLLRLYSKREFTYRRDKVPALLGIITIFEERLRGVLPANVSLWEKLIAGLWKNDIQRGLCWKTPDSTRMKRTLPACAPSWSWLSIDGPLHFPDELIYEDSSSCVVRIEDGDSSKFPYSGRLIIKTKFGRLSSLEDLRQFAAKAKLDVYMDVNTQSTDDQKFILAYLATLWHNVVNEFDIVPNWSVYFLILVPLPGYEAFQRVGIAKNKNPWCSVLNPESYLAEEGEITVL